MILISSSFPDLILLNWVIVCRTSGSVSHHGRPSLPLCIYLTVCKPGSQQAHVRSDLASLKQKSLHSFISPHLHNHSAQFPWVFRCCQTFTGYFYPLKTKLRWRNVCLCLYPQEKHTGHSEGCRKSTRGSIEVCGICHYKMLSWHWLFIMPLRPRERSVTLKVSQAFQPVYVYPCVCVCVYTHDLSVFVYIHQGALGFRGYPHHSLKGLGIFSGPFTAMPHSDRWWRWTWV